MSATPAPTLPFRAFNGEGAFVFVSYAHADAERVFPILELLHAAGLNIWYDEGISPGESWQEEIARALEGARECVLLVTDTSVTRPNCLREVNFALARDKPFLAIHLDDVRLPAGLELAISDRQAILRSQFTEAEFEQRLLEHFGLATPDSAAALTRAPARQPAPTQGAGHRPRHWLALAAAACTLLVVLGAVLMSDLFVFNHTETVSQLTDRAQLLRDAGDNVAAWQLLHPLDTQDATTVDTLNSVSALANIHTEPPGAQVAWRAYASDAPWQPLGTTPVLETRLPRGFFEWRFQLDGHVPRVLALQNPAPHFDNLLGQTLDPVPGRAAGPMHVYRVVHLPSADGAPPGMVYVQAGPVRRDRNIEQLAAFWIGRFEVTNAQYQAFVDAGGYTTGRWWQGLEFVENGVTISHEQALARMVDQTGRPGAATWELGRFPAGRDQHPVTGVSWYEATAYARYRERQLPTDVHWKRAAHSIFELAAPAIPSVAEHGNYEGDDTWPVGGSGPSPVGAFDIGGNAREWLANDARGDGKRELRGGAYSQYFGHIQSPDAAAPMNRSPMNGIRLAQYDPDPELSGPVAPPGGWRELADAAPMSDEAFEVLSAALQYEPAPFQAGPSTIDATNRQWVTESTSLPTVDGASMELLIVRPHGEGPFQGVIYWPGVGALFTPRLKAEDAGLDPRFVVTSGRALIRPAWFGMYDRRASAPPPDAPLSVQREYDRRAVIAMRNDMGRLIDYLQTRPDIDAERLALMAFSNGLRFLGAVHSETRVRTVIMIAGGISAVRPLQPLAEPVHFLPRITRPVLMLNGRQDAIFSHERQVQMFGLLGTPPDHARHVSFEHVGHAPLPRAQVMRETADWLDRQLGPVR